MQPFVLIIVIFVVVALFSSARQGGKKAAGGSAKRGADDGEPRSAVGRGLADVIREIIDESEDVLPNGPFSREGRTSDMHKAAEAKAREMRDAAEAKTREMRDAAEAKAQRQAYDTPNVPENGAQTLVKTISAYPPEVQGVIWSEVLNPPVSMR